ncbi:terminase small subunit [Odoribacter laneus]|jgi:phage terminase small subunit|uniref:terminase small subunit n=1 Tax=Odoribacter laneus TaxID=626933 RepID=UPI003FEDC6DF
MHKLTIKRENFCNYYVETGNASEAYRRAFACKNMKDKTITEAASRLINDSNVNARIKELQGEIKKKSDITKEKILYELDCIINAKITDYIMLEEGRLSFKDFNELTESQVKAIESVKQGKNGIELKLHGKSWSIERICKMLGYDAPVKIEDKRVTNFESMSDEELKKYIGE